MKKEVLQLANTALDLLAKDPEVKKESQMLKTQDKDSKRDMKRILFKAKLIVKLQKQFGDDLTPEVLEYLINELENTK